MKPSAIIESILFASGEPVTLKDLASLLAISRQDLTARLDELQAAYASRGIRLVRDDRTAQLVTAPEAGEHVARFLNTELRGKLSPGALETLAVIAYKGPVTRPAVDSIRGVNSAGALRTLAVRGLVADVGRTNEPGRPILYDTTLELLKHLGVASRDDLPRPPEELAAKLVAHEKAETVA